jgi:hypothetical protein
MSFTFKSRLGKLKMGSTPTLTLLDTTSSLNFASLKITNSLNLDYSKRTGILHTDGNGSVTSSLLDTTDIAPLAVTSDKLQDSIFLSGVPTTTTADADDSSVRIATTAFVQNTITNVLGNAPATLNTLKELADAIGNDANFVSNIGIEISKKVSLNGNESINGTKTFTSLPILSSFTAAGIVHNNSDGSLSTDLIKTTDIANAAVTFSKLDTNLVLPFNTTLEPLDEGDAYVTQSLVTVGLLTSNKPLPSPQGFFHITQTDTTIGPNETPIYTVGANTKYILETDAKIYLPPITHEGMFFSITNKSRQIIVVSTRTPETDQTSGVNMYSYFVAPDGDDEFEVDNNRTLDVISQITQEESSWQARFY